MNAVRSIVHSSFRGYRSFRGRQSAAWASPKERETPMVQRHMPVMSLDEMESDDYDHDAYESDFSSVGKCYTEHKKELEKHKLNIKYQIVKRKYFQSKEPAMLTWGEKEQIRLLNKQDPEEWTPEKLSESFPASTEAILKVIRGEWQPKSTKVIEKYENQVKENWKLFKVGKLPVEPKLREHLEKFKGRNITLMNEETMKKFVKPKPYFPKPKSAVFSDIIKKYSEEDKETKDPREKEKKPLESVKKLSAGSSLVAESTDEKAQRPKRKLFTYDEFLKKHVNAVDGDNMTPVDRVIVDEYKKRNAEAYKEESLVLQSQSAIGIFKSEETTEKKKETSLAVKATGPKEDIPKTALSRIIEENSMETGIIARKKREEVDLENYPDVIKVPKRKYKFNVTFRIQDRYYDADGEFLYRVPGLML